MRKLLLFLFFVALLNEIAKSQDNSWIDYNQSYYKFDINEDGLYRISFQTLLNANVSLSSIDPNSFQVFARGKEVPIYIKGEGDGVFNATDYIEFYAKANDGWLDTSLYKSSANQPNPYYSLINDTISYFLTWNTSTNNLRFKEENAIDFSNFFKSAFVWKEKIQRFTSNFYDGEILNSGLLDPEYVPSEGWLDAPLTLGASKTKVIRTPNRYVSGPLMNMDLKIAGESNWGGVNNGDHHIRVTIGNQVIDTIFEAYKLVHINRTFSPTNIISGNNNFRIASIDDRNAGVDRTALAYIKLTYPQSMNFGNNDYYEFLVDDAGNQSAQFLEILLFKGGNSPVLYDLTNEKKIRVVTSLTNYKTLIPNGNGQKRCVIAAEDEIKQITNLISVGENAKFTDYESMALDTSFLMITHQSLFPEVTRYASYRRSQGYNTLIALIGELYDQYAYGIKKHPMAIRNFVAAAFNWTSPPSHLFLVGKSVNAKDHRLQGLKYQKNLVPTIGNPATDNLLVAGLNGSILEPAVPIGRLSAERIDQVGSYLDKVIEYESAEPNLWMKRALHFAGGKSALETNSHENFLNGFSMDFQSQPYGGEAKLFRKSTSSPFQITLADSIRKLVNEGVAMLTFFGHSSATGGFDISIDTPDKLQNQGKYHLLLANSCFAGNTHQADVLSTSEQYVLEPRAGAIAFIASGNLGFSFFLNQYSSAFYENFAGKNYGKSLAENMRFAVQDIQGQNPSVAIKSVSLEMTLQGDPAIVLNAQPNADYQITSELFSVEPKEVTTDLDSFRLHFTVQNIGRAISDSMLIRIERKYPNGIKGDSSNFILVGPVANSETFSFTFPVDNVNDIGLNEFTFIVDPFNEIEELSELNNRVDVDVLIRSGEIIPVYPYNYSIVGSQSPSLQASTAFAFEEEKNYVFELDTSAQFTSSFKQSINVLSKGGVVEWQPQILDNMEDSAVFFWRVSIVPEDNVSFNWRMSSFQFINGESGWSQYHFDQFDDNEYLFIKQDQLTNRFDFTDRASELFVKTIGTPPADKLNDIFYALDADTRERSSCFAAPAFLIAVLDSLTFESWETPFGGKNLQNDFGQANVDAWCFPNRNRSEQIFNFQARDTMQLFAMRDFLNNRIPNGAYVVAYNWFNIDFDAIRAIDSTILQAFVNIGSTEMASIKNDHPFIITVQKGKPQSMIELVGDSTNSSIEIKRVLTTNADFGNINSKLIGPSNKFKRLTYQFSSLEAPSSDSIMLELIGLTKTNTEEIIFSSNKMRIDTSTESIINPLDYNRVKFDLRAYDQDLQTPPQLGNWQVTYEEFPDIALAPNHTFTINKDSLQRGESLMVELAFKNVSKVDMDSLPIVFSVINESNKQLFEIAQQEVPFFKADSTIVQQIEVPTANLVGSNTLLVEVNPGLTRDEIHAFNNFGQFDFFVFDDNLNPLLDVTFDGRHIVNREIVSANPQIDITLRDDNSFLIMDDTSTFSIFLKAPNQEEQLLNYGANAFYDLQFSPATGADNRAMVRLKPQLNQDGVYKLLVKAKDKSGNASGQKDYEIEFEVINRSTVTRLLNYPNPFSTSTRFVFTLTGSQVPDQIQIQIMTITGKVVREIDQFELGPIHIGNNITEYAWDGKDKYGDQLANGVYLYRVKMRINGSDLERRATNADKYFKRDFGKMYLLR